jgi:hypothetical protein
MNLVKKIPCLAILALAILLSAQQSSAQTVFQHPGVLLSKAQLDFVKAEVTAKVSPFYQEFLDAQASIYGQATPYTPLGPYPGGINQCGSNSTPDNGCSAADQDSTTAYVQALLWYITGNPIYATNAINIMNAYGYNFQGWAGFTAGIPCPGLPVTCSNGPVQAGWDATKWPRAAEIIRYSNAGWSAADIQTFSNMLANIYEPQLYNGSGDNGNWELAMIEGMMGIAVFNEDTALLAHAQLFWSQRVPAYFYYDPIDQGTPQPFPRNTGSTTWNGQVIFNASVSGIAQETCRDIKHTSYGIASALNAAETDAIQGGTLYLSQEPRLITGLEFNANLEVQGLSISGTSLPVAADMCTNDTNGKERETVTLSQGFTWVIGYNEFHNRLNQPMPWTEQWIQQGVLATNLPVDVGGHMIVFEPLTHYEDVTSAAMANFAVAASPATQSISPGAGTSYTVTVTPANGYAGNVTLSIPTGLPVAATATFSPATISGGSGTSTLTITTTASITPGNYTLVVSATDGSINRSTPVTLSIIGPLVTITAANQSLNYGGTVPALTYTVSPLVALHTVPTCVSAVNGSSAPGVYPGAITCSGATRIGYSIAYVAGQMTVNPLGTITISANNQSMTFGGNAPTLTYTVSPATTLTANPTCTSTATASTLPGSYAGAITCSGAALAGYAFTYVPAQMTVNFVSQVTPVISWTPAAASQWKGHHIGTTVLNATCSTTAGSFAYFATPASGTPIEITPATVLAKGSYTLSAAFTPSNTVDYTSAVATKPYIVSGQVIWVVNSNGSISALDNSGGAISDAATTGGGEGIAIDSAGSIWSINPSAGSIAEFSNLGEVITGGYSGGGLSSAAALAVDGGGSVWAANGNNSISEFNNAGVAVSPSAGYTGGGISAPAGVSIDISGNVWIANSGNNSVSEILGGASPVDPIAIGAQTGGLGVRP